MTGKKIIPLPRPLARKAIALICLLGFVFAASAQGTPSLDTAVSFQEDPPPEIVTESTIQAQPAEDEEEGLPKFVPNWIPPAKADSFRLRHLPDSFIRELRADEDFWYANLRFVREQKVYEESDNESYGLSPAWDTALLVIIIAAFAAFIGFYLFSRHKGIFRNSKTLAAEEELTETDDIFSISFDRELARAEAAGNFRLAVRLLFLQQLRELEQRNIIQYKQDRTNFEYLSQLRHTNYYRDFFRLTRHYEYTWYGHFAIDQEKYNRVKNEFGQFNHQLKHA